MMHRNGSFFMAMFLMAIAITLTGCLEGRSFHESSRLAVTRPAEGSAVTLPLRIGFELGDVPEGATAITVFVDRLPISPGTSVDEITGADRALIHEVDLGAGDVELAAINRRTGGPAGLADRHTITLVFTDASGVRVGDDYASIEVDVERE